MNFAEITSLGERILDVLAAINRTHSKYPQDSRDDAYTRSYRVTRLAVGALGVLLPIAFIVGETFFLKGGVHVRGSLSEYYHTSMQDIFVGGLCVIGFLLATYMAGEPATLGFLGQPDRGRRRARRRILPHHAVGPATWPPACGTVPWPAGLFLLVEQTLGEHQTAVIHGVCAIVFIFFLAVMSFLFATSEVLSKAERLTAVGQPRPGPFQKPAFFWIQGTCTLVILAAGAWAFWGASIGPLTRLYIGEVASVWAFAVSWILAGLPSTAPARAKSSGGVTQSPSPATGAALPR